MQFQSTTELKQTSLQKRLKKMAKFSKLVDPNIVNYVRDHCVRETVEQTELRRVTSEKLESKSIMISSPEQVCDFFKIEIN